MKHSQAEFDRALAQAIGNEPLMADDLTAAFHDSMAVHRAALGRARDADAWTRAAARLEGLAASFAARPLMAAAAAARISPPGDPVVLSRIDRAIVEATL